MKAVDRRVCPVCGNKFSGAMEFCPICMLRKPLGGETEAGDSSAKTIPTHAPHRFEHYELMCDEDGKPIELGRGAMGVTYKALNVDLRCPVALKVINEKYLGDESVRLRFLREAIRIAREQKSISLEKRAEATYGEYQRLSGWAVGRHSSGYYFLTMSLRIR
jgi:hypothetical protein